jgi:hypothetical protein
MAEIKLPDIRPAKTIEGKLDALYDAYFVMRKYMTYYLSGNLDEENVVRAQEAVIANVLAGTIKADQIDVTEGKIQAAQIEDLIVGDNVIMGANATISWNQVTGTEQIPLRTDLTWDNLLNKPTNLLTQSQLTEALTNYVTTGQMTEALADTLNLGNFSTIITKDYIASMNLIVGQEILMGANARISWLNIDDKPSIPSQYTDAQALNAWKNSGYATWIDANGVYSGAFNGGMFNINPTGDPYLESGLTIGGWYNNGWIGQAFKIQYDPYGNGSFPGTIVSSVGGVPLIFELATNFDYYVQFRSGSNVSFRGNVDFTGANVTGLSAVAVFG